MDIQEHKIGVLMGGVSAEREVSLNSGRAVGRALDKLGLKHVEIDANSTVCSELKNEGITLAFVALHGGWGENGSLQGMLELMGIPYTGSGVLASALAMNKEASKKMFMHDNIKVAPFFIIERKDREKCDGICLEKKLDAPLFVKPVAEGSSVGVSSVKKMSLLKKALDDAYVYGDRAIIEKCIRGKEVHIGILGDRVLGGVEVRPSDEFYSYHAKYTGGATEYILPPELDPDTYDRTKNAALRAHRALGCSGVTRVDTIVDESKEIYVLEVNTIPGMTETSLIPKIASHAGYDFPGLIKEMLIDALRSGGYR